MDYVNVGASVNGARVRTKKQLRQLLADEPASVWFDSTSPFNDTKGYRGNEVPDDIRLSVVLPDPYTDRRYYATVERRANRTLKVS